MVACFLWLLGLLYVHVDFADESSSAGLNSLKKKFDKIPVRLDCCYGPEQIPEKLDNCCREDNISISISNRADLAISALIAQDTYLPIGHSQQEENMRRIQSVGRVITSSTY